MGKGRPPRRATAPRTASIRSVLVAVLGTTLAIAYWAAPPVAAHQTDLAVVATGLFNPRGLAFGPDGALYIAEAGRGGDVAVKAGADRVPYQIGRTARVVRVTPSDDIQVVVDGLPSVHTPDDVFGVTGVAFVDETLYALTAAGGRDVGDPTFDNTILRVGHDGEVTVVANLTQANYADPPVARLRDLRADVEGGVPYGLATLGGRLYATDGNLETVTEIALDGSLRRLLAYPASDHVLVGLAPAPDGSLWVAEYGPWPHPPGAAKISRLTLDGQRVDAWTGLSTAIGVAFGPDGSSYALEFSSGRRVPATGRVLRRSPEGRVEVVATGLTYPTGLTVGPDGSLYVSEFGHRSDDGTGRIVRIRATE